MAAEGALAGRNAELETINALLDRLDAEAEGRSLQIVGEPGIGKSRLLKELSDRAEQRGHLVLAGRAAEFERDLPFGVFVAAVDDYVASLDLAQFSTLGTTATAELATVFPALVPSADWTAVAVQGERFRTYRSVRAFLEVLGRTRPLVLMLDDVHWADSASSELLAYLLAHPPQAHVLLATAFRPAQIPPRLGQAHAAAVRNGESLRVDVEPLSRSEVEELVARTVGRDGRDALYRESGGNPFYLEQLQRSLGTTGRGQLAGAGASAVPGPVALALAEEVMSLEHDARTLIEAATVAGDPFDAWIAVEVAGMDEPRGLHALDTLTERDLLRITSVPGRFRFRHPIVRRALYDAMKPSWRIAAHARAATALRARGSPAASLAHHLERSACVGDDEAAELLIEAAATALSRAPATAAHWYDCALRILPDDDGERTTGRRTGLWTALAAARAGAGQLAGSRKAIAQAMRGPLPMTQRVALASWAAALDAHLGRAREARDDLLTFLGQLDDTHSVEAVALQLVLTETSVSTGTYEEACRWARQALDSARELDAPALRVGAAGKLALGEFFLGNTEQADQHLDEAVLVLDGLGDDVLAGQLDAVYTVAMVEAFQLERFDNATRHAERGARLCRTTGQGQFLLPLLMALSWSLKTRGHVARSLDVAHEAVEANRVTANEYGLMATLCVLAGPAIDSGDPGLAMAASAEAFEIARRIEAGAFAPLCAVAFARCLVETGSAARARRVVIEGCGGARLPALTRFGRCDTFEVMTQAELSLGNITAAWAWASEARRSTERRYPAMETAIADRAMAAVLLAEGEGNEAAALALVAAEAAGRVGARIEEGRARLLAGRALAQAGRRLEAIAELERVEAEMLACGAARHRDEAARELERLDRSRARTRAAKVAGLDGLTERERCIAELIRAGRTNREIAADLYLSVKTVERHVSHVFDKLGVSTRASVASVVASDLAQDRQRAT